MTIARTDVPDLAEGLLDDFKGIRTLTERLAGLLSPEDQTAQSMPDASPTKWHRGHTTWFFEEFVLCGTGATPQAGYTPYDPTYRYLFNSYYDHIGARHPRPERGLVTRPGVEEIARYRQHVDDAMAERIAAGGDQRDVEVMRLGLNHEQQHQELLVMDAKHLLSRHPFAQVLVARPDDVDDPAPAPLRWRQLDGGLVEIGHDTGDGFAFDNESPRHAVWLE